MADEEIEEKYQQLINSIKKESLALYKQGSKEITPIIRDIARAKILQRDKPKIAKDMLNASWDALEDVKNRLSAKLIFWSRDQIENILVKFFAKVLLNML